MVQTEQSVYGRAEWWTCEDCLGTGGMNGVDCGTCAGAGQLPANAAADAIVEERNNNLQQMAFEVARRDIDDDHGDFNHLYD